MERQSGIILSISSLPSPYGIGTFGHAAYAYADFLADAGQTLWQMLPLGPVSAGDSPYQSFSTYAGNPYYIDPELLVEDALLTGEEVDVYDWGDDLRYVDYGKIYVNRFNLLDLAWKRGRERDKEAFEAWAREQDWLPDYALFMACKRHFGMKCWCEWPDEDLRARKPESLTKYRELLAEDVAFFSYLQFLFFKQWDALRNYIHGKGIRVIGDLPIYVALDSADVWCEPEQFQLGEDGMPTEVAGCPPDAFTEDGQLWGNPLYDWDHMKADGFGWWIRRISGASKLYDVIRIDHFRGFSEYWAIPAGDPTAKNGRWKKGPGMDLIGVLNNWFSGISFVAEDLGASTPELKQLLKDSGWPGMKVLEFAFEDWKPSDYLPHNHTANCICYTGTHDNEPLGQWIEDSPEENLAYARSYLGIPETEDLRSAVIRCGMSSVAPVFIAQMQDYLGLGAGSRMNQPGEPCGWWRWRLLPEELKGPEAEKLAAKLKAMTQMYGRMN